MIYRSLITTQEDGEDVDPHLVVHVPPVQQQSGTNDCGVYAIAFAVHAALGDNLKDIEFDQPKLRARLLQKERTTLISNCEAVRGNRSKHFPYREIELYCFAHSLCPIHTEIWFSATSVNNGTVHLDPFL